MHDVMLIVNGPAIALEEKFIVQILGPQFDFGWEALSKSLRLGHYMEFGVVRVKNIRRAEETDTIPPVK